MKTSGITLRAAQGYGSVTIITTTAEACVVCESTSVEFVGIRFVDESEPDMSAPNELTVEKVCLVLFVCMLVVF